MRIQWFNNFCIQDKLPAMQVEFIDSICLPVYKNLIILSDQLQPMLTGEALWRFSKSAFKNMGI